MTDDGGWLIPDEIPPHLLDDDGLITFAQVRAVERDANRVLTRYFEHRSFMAAAHNAWETLYGTPCGPYDPRRAGHPMGLIVT